VRILVIRLSSLGDIVLTTPALAFIREHLPNAALDFVCKARYAPLLEADPALARVLAFPKEGLIAALRHARLIRFARIFRAFRRDLSAYRYDHVIDLHNVTESAIIALLCKKAIRTGNKRQLLSLFFTHRIALEDRNERALHHASFLAILSVLGSGAIPDPAPVPSTPSSRLSFDAHAASEAERFIRERGLDGKRLAGINPSASYDFKRWPLEGFARVAGEIQSAWGHAIVLFGAERDRALLEELRRRIQSSADTRACDLDGSARAAAWMPHSPRDMDDAERGEPRHSDRASVHIACGLALPTVAALIARLGYMIGADSGLMHIAAAFNIPQATIFGHSSFLKFYPLSGRARVVRRELACSPCTPSRARKCRKRACMEIGSAEVWREVLTLVMEHYPDTPCRCSCEKPQAADDS